MWAFSFVKDIKFLQPYLSNVCHIELILFMWFLKCLNPVSFLKNIGVSNICKLRVHCVHFVIDTSTEKYSIIFSLLDAGANGKVGIRFNTYHSYNLQNKDGVQKQ